ncbi:SDR family oxidoreductase [Desulfuromonas carbonis]|uniref:SDR family oxidoreductase n=1 Tax=Desulfuromonas sp. DDH964 TaxID=1823759 RepID=UPI00078E4D5E|nr:SDR family oxidoreductase [Desulfuromonas sp. DDH964]AMV71268.1 short-chain dehydrogenase [Desulfuromonas sp. DDH964]
MSTLLITGANRGIGLELVKVFAGKGWRVLACCRRPEVATELQSLAAAASGVTIHRLEVTDGGQIAALATELAGTPIDILLNNAGIKGPKQQGFGQSDEEGWLETFRVNTIAPMRLTEALVEQVAASERRIVATLGTVMGSIAENSSGGYYAYRTSKAAVHMLMKGLAIDLAARGILTVSLHPGWVRTSMGGKSAPVAPAESAAGLAEVLLGLTPEQSGGLYDFEGKERPW